MTNPRDNLFDSDFLARLEQLHLLGKRIATRRGPGQRRSRRLGNGLEFADHRDYAPGEDLRFIDWPYFARMEKLLLRMFHEHSEGDVMIMLDASASMAPGGDGEKFRYARRTAAALAYVAMGSFERVTLLPFSQELGRSIQTPRNRTHILPVLDFLSQLDCQGKTDIGRCVQQLEARRPHGTVLVLSDLLDCSDELSEALARLRAGCDVVVVHVYSPADARPAMAGAMVLHPAESGGELSLNVTEELLTSYAQRWQEFQHTCERTCLSRGATYIAADTATPFESLVLQTLRRASVLS